jgi:hypothetical protein
MPHHPMSRQLWLAAAALALVGCGGSIPHQVLSGPAPTPPTAGAPSVLDGPFVVHRATERRSYAIDTRGVLTVQRDTVTTTDSLGSQLEVAYTAFAGTPRVTGSITAYRVRAGDGSLASPSTITLPIAFAATYATRGGALAFSAPLSTGCAAAAAVVQGARDLWTRTPDTLRIGSSWQDSTLVVSCRDGITLRAATVRVFRVTGAEVQDGAVSLTLVRESRATIVGDGHPTAEPVTVSGSATGSLVVRYRPDLDAFTSGEGTQLLTLVLSSRVVSQRVTQRTQSRITTSSIHEP